MIIASILAQCKFGGYFIILQGNWSIEVLLDLAWQCQTQHHQPSVKNMSTLKVLRIPTDPALYADEPAKCISFYLTGGLVEQQSVS